jgi:hypothetical protein
MDLLPIVITGALSYKVCNLMTHPKSKVWNTLPRVKVSRFNLFPSIRIEIKGRVIHFHHWFNYSVLLCISAFTANSFLDSPITRGFLMGGVVQGLSIPSARKLIYKEDWLRKMLK